MWKRQKQPLINMTKYIYKMARSLGQLVKLPLLSIASVLITFNGFFADISKG